ncbi:aminotransferase class III-fold pyridoxal phosphate-dependent enzyme [Streptosporangium vulgare]|uniref:aminotransferase class III-fold pyridoxal phosphate-dependent enzyme n=1 Tax=Streptosporangium vulgare TaxID=46190 RepID=UPI003CD0581F
MLEIVERDGLIPRAGRLGAELLAALREIQESFPELAENARGRGLMCAFDLPDAVERDLLVARLREEEGVLVLPCGERSYGCARRSRSPRRSWRRARPPSPAPWRPPAACASPPSGTGLPAPRGVGISPAGRYGTSRATRYRGSPAGRFGISPRGVGARQPSGTGFPPLGGPGVRRARRRWGPFRLTAPGFLARAGASSAGLPRRPTVPATGRSR